MTYKINLKYFICTQMAMEFRFVKKLGSIIAPLALEIPRLEMMIRDDSR
jgi:hypothetical protein